MNTPSKRTPEQESQEMQDAAFYRSLSSSDRMLKFIALREENRKLQAVLNTLQPTTGTQKEPWTPEERAMEAERKAANPNPTVYPHENGVDIQNDPVTVQAE